MKAAILCALLLSGCATGIEMTKDEATACKAQGCSVWTVRELTDLARKFYTEGYKAGVKSL